MHISTHACNSYVTIYCRSGAVDYYGLHSFNMFIHIWLQEAPVMEYAQVDKSQKRASQEKQQPNEECDTMVKEEVTQVSI